MIWILRRGGLSAAVALLPLAPFAPERVAFLALVPDAAVFFEAVVFFDAVVFFEAVVFFDVVVFFEAVVAFTFLAFLPALPSEAAAGVFPAAVFPVVFFFTEVFPVEEDFLAPVAIGFLPEVLRCLEPEVFLAAFGVAVLLREVALREALPVAFPSGAFRSGAVGAARREATFALRGDVVFPDEVAFRAVGVFDAAGRREDVAVRAAGALPAPVDFRVPVGRLVGVFFVGVFFAPDLLPPAVAFLRAADFEEEAVRAAFFGEDPAALLGRELLGREVVALFREFDFVTGGCCQLRSGNRSFRAIGRGACGA